MKKKPASNRYTLQMEMVILMVRNHAYERAHLMLLQLGFGAWELIGLRKNGKRICRS